MVVIVIDDMGFGAPSPFGGPCQLPTADRLAADGLRYSRFHVTALCSPTRQALMTGRNHHSVGMGVTSEMATSHPGYSGYRPASAATLAQILHGNGWSTAAFGKWHQTPSVEVTASGPFTRWPTGEGFDTFYGFMGAEMNHWYPQLYAGTTPVEPDRLPEEGYHLTEDLVDHAVDWVRTQQSLTPDRPFFTYLALGATHAPFHVATSGSSATRAASTQGWDAMREEILERQKKLGIVAPDTELSPWADGVPHWDELDDAAKRVAIRLMETYAGFAEHADQQVGRLVDALDELEVLDDTLFVYLLGDNGASGEGGIEGTIREHLVGHGIADDIADMDARIDEIGGPTTYAMYPVGWALAMNTPYQWTKQVASHFGGTRDGLVVHWPVRHEARGEIRHQFHHVIDLLPTVLDAAGLPMPETVDGVAQQRVEGTSMRYSFDDPDAEERRPTQYFEMVGNRGIYHEGWTAVTRHGSLEDDRGAATVRPRHLGALRHPHGLVAGPRRRGRRPRAAGQASGALRRGGREAPGLPARRPGHRAREPRARRPLRPALRPHRMVLGRHTGRLSEEAAPNVKNRSHRITVDLDIPADHPPQSTNGVLVAQGGRFGGWSLYVVAGRPALRLQPLRQGPHRGAGELGAVAGRARGGAGLQLRRRSAWQRWEATILHRRRRRRAGSGSRRPRRTTSPSTRPSTWASTAAARSSTTTHRCATGSPARSAGWSSTSTRAPCWTRRHCQLASRAHD